MVNKLLQQKVLQTIETIPDFPKQGIQYKDISPIFCNIPLYEELITDFANYSQNKVDAVCGIESRGFIFGIGIAAKLGIPFFMIRKKGKVPPPIVAENYALEYGEDTIEMRLGQIKSKMRVLIHDDLLATGGTTEAAAKLIEKQGGLVKQFSFLINLKDLKGEEKLISFSNEIYSVLEF